MLLSNIVTLHKGNLLRKLLKQINIKLLFIFSSNPIFPILYITLYFTTDFIPK